MSKIIGIDLGTTNSCVSVIENGNVTVITNAEGNRTTPSIVAFTKDGERKVGEPAKRQAVVNPKKTISSIKRFMGQNYDSIIDEIKYCTYEIVNDNGFPKVKIDDKTYTPQEISAMILQKMKKIAEDYLGVPVKDAVITVPAYFNDSQRQATKEAGEIAGLNVRRIINEPTAAALAYGLNKSDEDKVIAVFDLGGGTFDISILEIGDGIFEVKSTNGDTHLGGNDFDQALINYLADEFKNEHGVDLRKDTIALQRLKEAVEKAKIELSSVSQTEINIPYIIPVNDVPKHLVKTLNRSEFEKIIEPLLSRLKEPCYKAIEDSGYKVDEISEVILVGGSTRIPAVQRVVKEIFGKEPSKNVNPDEAVSIGAAIQGSILLGETTDILLLDVTPLSLGIEIANGMMAKIIEANTTIPTRKSEMCTTIVDNQTSVEIHVLQGERALAKDNKSLGRFVLEGIEPAPRGVPKIEVTFDIDANGILSVKAIDKNTGKENYIRIEGTSNLNKDEIERMKREAEIYYEQDEKEKNERNFLYDVETIIYEAEKKLNDTKNELTDDEKNNLKNKIDIFKKMYNEKNIDFLKSEINEFKNYVYNL